MKFLPYLTKTGKYVGTLCTYCKNAVPNKQYGCPWSISFEPIKGWEAIPTLLNCNSKHVTPSFCVVSCPLFDKDEERDFVDAGDQEKAYYNRLVEDDE